MYDYYELEDHKMRGLRDWRKALRTPATYRVGNAVRIQPQFMFLIVLIGVFLLILFYYNWCTSGQSSTLHVTWTRSSRPYNATYPLSSAFQSGDVITYKIGIVADLDTNSKSNIKPYTFISYLKRGFLSYDTVKNHVTVTWDKTPTTILSSTYSHKGRGMELSELIVYDGRLLTFDDRSGMVIIFTIIYNTCF